jgi:hypothetical protein
MMLANAATDLCCEQYHVTDLDPLLKMLMATGAKPFGVERRDLFYLVIREVTSRVIVENHDLLARIRHCAIAVDVLAKCGVTKV